MKKLNYELFLAKRIIASKSYKSSISSPIIKIAIVAIALGIIIMMISIATGLGLQQKIREKVSGFNGHIQITNFDSNNSDVTLIPVDKNQDFYPNFTTIDGVNKVQIYATKAGIIRTETDFEGVVVKGVSSDYDWSFFEDYLVKGKLPVFNNDLSFEVLISRTISDRLNLDVGNEVNVFFVKEDINKPPIPRVFKIAGLYDSGFEEFDKNYMLADIKHIQKLNKWTENQVGGFEVFLDNFKEIEEKSNQIYAQTASSLNSQSILEKFPGVFEWIDLFDINIIIIIVMMILIAGINMITALLVLILERTQMIGILKALGSSTKSIQKIFLYNATYLIIRGLFWGNLIGLSIILTQHYFGIITLNPENYYVKEAPVYITIMHIIVLNLGTLLLCFLMLILPTFIISKISPVKAIKFE